MPQFLTPRTAACSTVQNSSRPPQYTAHLPARGPRTPTAAATCPAYRRPRGAPSRPVRPSAPMAGWRTVAALEAPCALCRSTGGRPAGAHPAAPCGEPCVCRHWGIAGRAAYGGLGDPKGGHGLKPHRRRRPPPAGTNSTPAGALSIPPAHLASGSSGATAPRSASRKRGSPRRALAPPAGAATSRLEGFTSRWAAPAECRAVRPAAYCSVAAATAATGASAPLVGVNGVGAKVEVWGRASGDGRQRWRIQVRERHSREGLPRRHRGEGVQQAA
jgi:hypothetical protein